MTSRLPSTFVKVLGRSKSNVLVRERKGIKGNIELTLCDILLYCFCNLICVWLDEIASSLRSSQ